MIVTVEIEDSTETGKSLVQPITWPKIGEDIRFIESQADDMNDRRRHIKSLDTGQEAINHIFKTILK